MVAGGILIDVDHIVDFILFSRDKRPSPRRIYAYNLNLEYGRVLFCLHSYELIVGLAALAIFLASPILWGLFIGMALHLVFDVVFNAPIHKRPVLFYLLLLRLWHKCDVKRLENRAEENDP